MADGETKTEKVTIVKKKSTEPLAPFKRKKVVKRTTKRRNNSTSIFTQEELTSVLKDVVNPVNVAEMLTGTNVVKELKSEKGEALNGKSNDPKVTKSFMKGYLVENEAMCRETFADSNPDESSPEEEFFDRTLRRKSSQSARGCEVNHEPF